MWQAGILTHTESRKFHPQCFSASSPPPLPPAAVSMATGRSLGSELKPANSLKDQGRVTDARKVELGLEGGPGGVGAQA